MEILPNGSARAQVCAVEQLARYVDSVLNTAAIQEFEDATSETQDSGADLGEGSVYLDDTPISFTPESVMCGLCKGMAYLSAEGSIEADECLVTGYCEVEWARNHPEQYKNEAGELAAEELVCGAELGCNAHIVLTDLDGAVEPVVKKGECNVATLGLDWRKKALAAVKGETLANPDDGIEQFDGAGSGREE